MRTFEGNTSEGKTMWSFGGSSQAANGQGTAPVFGGNTEGRPPMPGGASGSTSGFGGGFGSAGGGMVFGSSSGQQQPQSQPQPQPGGGFGSAGGGMVFGSSSGQQQPQRLEREREEAIDYEQAKREALQSMPKFAGNKARQDVEDVKKKKERAARFATTSTAAIEDRKAQVHHASTSKSEKKAIIGTCEDMCPAAERERRQNMSDIQIFERLHPDNMNETSAELAVKRFARTVDDPHPSDFRTRGALERTMNYLRNLLDREDVRFGLVHKFLWDRYRSVRQDLYIQGITDQFAINIFEEIVRFHVLCEHELCGEDQSVTDMEGFNSHLNMEQMNKALISLNDMYEKAAEKGEQCPNEPEFRSYHLLSLMSQHGKFKGDQQGFLSMLQSLRQNVRESASIQWVLQLRSAFAFGNFAKFFALIKQAPYLLACLSHIYFPQMRAKCLKIMSETVAPGRPVQLEASWLVRVLLLDSEEEALNLAKLHGFESSLNDRSEASVLLVKGEYVPLPTPIERHPSKFISRRAPGKRSACVVSSAPAPDAEAMAAAAKEHQEAMRKKEEEQRERERLAREEQERVQRLMKERQEEEARERERREREEMRLQQERLEREKREMEEKLRQERERAEALAREERLRQEKAQREREEREEKERQERQRREEEARLAMERRKAEEERRKYLIQKLKEAIISQKYWDLWLAETRSRILEKERVRRSELNLKGCRVGALRIGRKRCLRDETTPNLPKIEKRGQLIRVADVAEPILCEKNPTTPELFWKIAVLSSHESFANDPLARYLHTFAALDGHSTTSLEQNGDIVYQESGSLHVCMKFVSNWSISTDSLIESFYGSSGVIIVTDASKIAILTDSLRRVLSSITTTIWRGPSIPILVISLDSKSEAFIENGFHVRIISPQSLQDRASMEDALAWVASCSPQQPSFIVTSLKQSISQGLRSFINPHRNESRNRKGLQILSSLTPQEAAIDLVVKAIEASFKSAEASWQWPPGEFDCGPINHWYDSNKYIRLVNAVRAIFLEIENQIAPAQGAYQSSLLINSIIDTCTADLLENNDDDHALNIIIPHSVSHHGEYNRILELSNQREEDTDDSTRVGRMRRSHHHQHHLEVKHVAKMNHTPNDENLRSKLNALEEEVSLEKMLWNPRVSR